VGVHQDGLVHISLMSDKFISNPREVVKTGDIVKVHVISVDVKRKRISLSMVGPQDENKSDSTKAGSGRASFDKRKFSPAQNQSSRKTNKTNKTPVNSAFGLALADALKKKN
jgi:uncharacterized protein